MDRSMTGKIRNDAIREANKFLKDAGSDKTIDTINYDDPLYTNAMDIFDERTIKGIIIQDEKRTAFINKYMKKQALKNIKERYYKAVKKKRSNIDPEYIEFMGDKIGFMRRHGVAPLYEMPSFGNYQIFSTNGAGFGSSPKTISFNPGGSVPQGVIVGKRGDTLLDIERILHPDDIITLSGENYKKMASGKRDAGTRSVGDELLPFTRKTFASGGKIHIKPENRGKFTALKKRTGKSASWFKAHGTPAQKKMATFALNARKWHHGEGGYLNY